MPAVAALEDLADAAYAHEEGLVGRWRDCRRRTVLEGSVAQGAHLRANLALADAGGEAAAVGFRQRRAGAAAGVARPVAARGEAAGAGDGIGRRHGAADGDELRHTLRCRRLREEQAERVGMEGLALDVVGAADLEQGAGVEHVDAVAAGEGQPEIVGDEDHAHAPPALHTAEQLQDLGLGGHVEGGRGLVGDQQLRVARQRRGQGDALTHAARELERQAVRDVLVGDADLGHAPLHLRHPLRARSQLRRLRQHLLDMHPALQQRVQHREGILEHERDARPANRP